MEKNLIHTFLKFEETNKLFDIEIFGLPAWHVIRIRIYNLLYQQINGTQINHPKKKKRQSIFLILKSTFTSIYKSPFFLKQKDTIIFNHSRKIKNVQGFYECKYTEHLTSDNSYVFETPFQERHLTPSLTPNLFYLDLLLNIARVNGALSLFRFKSRSDKQKILKLRNLILDEFGVLLPNFEKFLQQLIFKHKALLFLSRLILKKIKPLQLIMTVAYSDINSPFVHEAKKMGVKVIEIQHGIMGENHVAYNFYEKNNFDWFPDEIWVWNEFWAKKSCFPINDDNIKIKGFPFLEKFKKENEFEKFDKKQILIISQGPFSDLLIDLALKLNNKLDKEIYQIAFRPHPSELAANAGKFKFLNEQKIILVKDNNIYNLFNNSKYQIGINSTALFEGIEFGLKTFIYKFKGYEIFKDIDHVTFVNNEIDIINNL